jgi:hypothetical protein
VPAGSTPAVSRVAVAGTASFTYDVSGSQRSKRGRSPSTTYSDDPLDRLTGLDVGGPMPTSTSYPYKGRGCA